MPNPKPKQATDHFESGMDVIRDEDNTPLDDEKTEKLAPYFEDGILDASDYQDSETEENGETNEESESEEEFTGFEAEPEPAKPTPAPPASTEDPLLVEMRGLTEEQFKELSTSNPAKALEMVVAAAMAKRDIRPVTSDDIAAATQQAVTINDSRRIIAARFQPQKNTDLKKRATEIYKERGFDVRKNPRAELDAFMLAVQEDPALNEGALEPENKVTPRRPNRGSGGNAIRLNQEHVRIAQNMGIDLSDPKTASRMQRLINDYERRRR